jgi:hypothetical protein
MLHMRRQHVARSLAKLPIGGRGELPTGGDNRHFNQESLIGKACYDQ